MLVGGLVLLLTPVNLVSLVLVLWLVTKDIKTKEIKPMIKVGESGMNGAPLLLAILLIAGSAFGLFWWTKILLGEIYLKNSLVSAAANDGGGNL